MTQPMLAPKRMVIAGLGNYSYPLTRHSIGQLVLTHLALKAASMPGSTGSGVLKLGKHQGKQAWTATVTVMPPPPPKKAQPKPKWIPRRPQPPPDGTDALATPPPSQPPTPEPPAPVEEEPKPIQPLELMFILPKLLMNVSGPAVTTFAALPVADPSAPKPPPSSSWSATFSKPATPTSPFLPSPPPPYSILTLQDDLDLPSFTTKVQRGGSPRGHNGVRSLSSALGGSRDFWRVRLGVGRPPDAGKKGKSDRGDVSGWVMGPLGGDEVKACEWEEGKGGGKVVEEVWEHLMRIGWFEEGQELDAPKKK